MHAILSVACLLLGLVPLSEALPLVQVDTRCPGSALTKVQLNSCVTPGRQDNVIVTSSDSTQDHSSPANIYSHTLNKRDYYALEKGSIIRSHGDESVYVVERHLGTGGQGSVYEATILTPQRPGAYKSEHRVVLKLEEPRKDRQLRLNAEYKAYKLIEKHAATRRDKRYPSYFMDAKDSPKPFYWEADFMVMEVHPVLGKSLYDYVETWGVLDGVSVARLGQHLLKAAQHIHRLGIIHNDIKPENLLLPASFSWKRPMVDQANIVEKIVLIDFGFANLEWKPRERLREDKAGDGSPEFMAIVGQGGFERGPPDDLESVIYTLAWLACGRLPWSRAHDEDAIFEDKLLIADDGKDKPRRSLFSNRCEEPVSTRMDDFLSSMLRRVRRGDSKQRLAEIDYAALIKSFKVLEEESLAPWQTTERGNLKNSRPQEIRRKRTRRKPEPERSTQTKAKTSSARAWRLSDLF